MEQLLDQLHPYHQSMLHIQELLAELQLSQLSHSQALHLLQRPQPQPRVQHHQFRATLHLLKSADSAHHKLNMTDAQLQLQL